MVKPEAAKGRRIISETLGLLRRSDLTETPDATRQTGRTMVTGAIVYDWLYPLLEPDEKQSFVTELVRLAKTQECGYPPRPASIMTGHASEAMIVRDMLSAGIAIHDEYPEMYELAAGQVIRRIVPARNWFYRGHSHHQGDSYGPYRFQWEMFATFIFAKLGGRDLFVHDQSQVPYQWLYTTRPDGQRLRSGDTFRDSTSPGRPWGEYAGGMLAASYYRDAVLMGQFLRQGGTYDDEVLFDFLWRDVELAPESNSALPWSRYFGAPFGWMVARTGWDDNAVVAEMKVNEYNFTNHQHLDAGAFQIYYRGPLAIDSGLYQRTPEGAYGRPHTRNYAWRTIAHNALLIYDPQESFGRVDWVNDGGQRLPNLRSEPDDLPTLLDPANGYRTGHVKAYGFGPDAIRPVYTLLQGDITAAYGQKVQEVKRAFAFLRFSDERAPAAMVIYDRVVSVDPAFKKFWLLHSMAEPKLAGAHASIRGVGNASGTLDVDVMLPRGDDLQLTKEGGPGREFWVFGQNYANYPNTEVLAKSTIEAGGWRLELSVRTPRAEDSFLVAMQAKQGDAPLTDVKRLEIADRVGCQLRRGTEGWIVLFNARGERSRTPFAITVPSGENGLQVLLTDLSPGRWVATPEGGGSPISFIVAQESGAGYFTATSGKWQVSPSF